MLDEQSFLDFKCPHCGEAVSFPQEEAGFPRACPACMETLLVPEDGSELGGKLPLPSQTARLVLRRFSSADWQDLLAVVSDEELFLYTIDTPLDEDSVLRWLESERTVKLTTPGEWFFIGLELKEESKLIGYASLKLSEREAGLFIRLHRDYQKKAYALEAMEGVLGFCFEGIKLHRVTAIVDSRNASACHLFERLGLRREGESVKNKWAGGEWVNTVHYAALEEDWKGPRT
jgi:RimJ/RimL family protein N-acetyltransferase